MAIHRWTIPAAVLLLTAAAGPLWASEDGESGEGTLQDEELGPLRYDDPLPRRTIHGRRPFLDFEHTEFHPFVSGIAFSSAFDADPTFGAGLLLRLPTSIFDGRVGLWGEVGVSRIERDLPFYYDNPDGAFYMFGGGVDVEVFHNEFVFLRPQIGVLYSDFVDVDGLDNGFGVLGGLSFGWHWIRFTRNVYMTLNPQLAFDGEDWMLLVNVGMGFDF